jgi:hypothetical protein
MKIEITHDLIAKKIYERASNKDRAFKHAQQIVQSKYELYVVSSQLLLSEEELGLVRPFIHNLSLSVAQASFLKLSDDTLQTQARWQYARTFLNAILLVGISISSWGWYQYSQAAQVREEKNKLFVDLFQLSQQIQSVQTAEDLRRVQNQTQTIQHQQLRTNNAIDIIQAAGLDTSLPAPPPPIQPSLTNFPLQAHTLKGHIRDKKGRPLPFCKVEIAGILTETDRKGAYQVHILTETSLLPDQLLVKIHPPKQDAQELNILIDKNNPFSYSEHIIE